MRTGTEAQALSHEIHDIANISHGLAVFSRSDHHETAFSYLFDETEHVSTVVLPENHGRPQNHQRTISVRAGPGLEAPFRLGFALAVFREGANRGFLGRAGLIEPVDRHAAREDDDFD